MGRMALMLELGLPTVKVVGAHIADMACTASSVWATFSTFYGICMEEHTCEARLPHINGKVVRKGEISIADMACTASSPYG